jgi:hypothetical protein
MYAEVDPDLVEATVDARLIAHRVGLVEKARRGQAWWLWGLPAMLLVGSLGTPLGAAAGALAIIAAFGVATWLAWRTDQRLDAIARLLLDEPHRTKAVGALQRVHGAPSGLDREFTGEDQTDRTGPRTRRSPYAD